MVTVKTKKDKVPVPCGKCPNCQSSRISGWSVRLQKQAEVSTSAFFVTLTYDNDNVPINAMGMMTLNKTDIQEFIGRCRVNMKTILHREYLRKISAAVNKRVAKLAREKKKKVATKTVALIRKEEKEKNPFVYQRTLIKYYCAGEYGEKYKRPHYHLIMYNIHPDVVAMSWKKGNVDVQIPRDGMASIGYTLKYINKSGMIPAFKGDIRLPEFSLMSKGLGRNYITDDNKKWHHANIQERMYVPLLDGQKATMPRYYKNLLYTPEQRKAIGAAATHRAEKEIQRLMLEYGSEWHNELEKRKKLRFQKRKQKQKDNGNF